MPDAGVLSIGSGQSANMESVSMKQVLVALVLIVSISACSGGNAKELFETGKFEELQNNKEHATELYEEVIRKYPKSEYAIKAEERLTALSRP